jgi:HD-like signal output (HDOD) protein/CheY-like chemotaxis protein
MISNNEQNEINGRVLFVDDEQSILSSLQRGFFLADFEVVTALGAKAGLKILENKEFDIIISDFRMPDMDGIQFLKIVKNNNPNISRIILSGFVEHSAVLRSLTSGVASTYFAKPWDEEILAKRINQILKIRKTLKNKKLLSLVNSIEQLPTLPSLYQEFMTALEDETKSIKEFADIINNDISVSTKVMQVANSAFYGLKNTTSLINAISYIGLNCVKDIILTISLTNTMKWDNEQLQLLRDIFFHSSLVNRYIPKIYSLHLQAEKINQFPAIGITHDIGKIILLQYFPEHYKAILTVQQNNPALDFYDSELSLGFSDSTHAEIGAYFLDWWNLPQIIIEVALSHHTPENCAGDNKMMLIISKLTNDLVNYLWNKRNDGNIDLSAFQFDNISTEKLKQIAAEIQEDFHERNKF